MKSVFKITKYLAFLLSVLLLNSNPGAIKAQNEVTLKIENTEQIDLCGADRNKRVIITLYMGKILPSDSLFGFNGQLLYNPDKIQFHTALPINTLAEFFDYNKAEFSERGKIIFNVSQWLSNYPISGNRPLFAFLGNYLGKCPDTSWVNLDYIEFTNEFKKTIKDVSNGLVNAEILYDDTRYLQTKFEVDTLEFLKDDQEKNIRIVFDVKPGLRISNLKLNIENENPSQFDIVQINSLNEYIIIDSVQENDGKIELYLSILNDTLAGIDLNLNIMEKFKSDTISQLSIEPTQVNECTCVSKLVGSNCFLKSNKIDTIPSWINFEDDSSKELNIDYKNNYLTIQNNNGNVQQVIITNLLGMNLMTYKPEDKVEIKINTELLTSGIYFVYIVKNNNKREIKKLIKN